MLLKIGIEMTCASLSDGQVATFARLHFVTVLRRNHLTLSRKWSCPRTEIRTSRVNFQPSKQPKTTCCRPNDGSNVSHAVAKFRSPSVYKNYIFSVLSPASSKFRNIALTRVHRFGSGRLPDGNCRSLSY